MRICVIWQTSLQYKFSAPKFHTFKNMRILNFAVAPCISNIKQFIVQLMHTDFKILRLLK